MVYINEKIIKMCDERKWSLYTLAEKADIPYSSLNSAINRDSAPKTDTLERVCEAFGITLAQFFIDDEEVEILDKEEKLLIALFRKLPKTKQKSLLELLEG